MIGSSSVVTQTTAILTATQADKPPAVLYAESQVAVLTAVSEQGPAGVGETVKAPIPVEVLLSQDGPAVIYLPQDAKLQGDLWINGVLQSQSQYTTDVRHVYADFNDLFVGDKLSYRYIPV